MFLTFIFSLLSFVLIIVFFLVSDRIYSSRNKKTSFMQKLTEGLNPLKRTAEISGVFIMCVPVILTFLPYKLRIEKTYLWFFTHRIEKDVSIQATMLTALAAIFIYCSYLVRYGFFKKENKEQIVFSVVQAVVNVWAISGLCSMFVGNSVWNLPFFNISGQTFLLMVVLLSWIGAKSIAGFLWILLIFAGISHITEINSAMGVYGALYVVLFFVSFLLQLSDIVHFEDLKNDFCGKAEITQDRIKKDVCASKKAVKKLL